MEKNKFNLMMKVLTCLAAIVACILFTISANTQYSDKVHHELRSLAFQIDQKVTEQKATLHRYVQTFPNATTSEIASRIQNLETDVFVIQYIDEHGRFSYAESGNGVHFGMPVPLLNRDLLIKGGHSMPVSDAEGRFYIGVAIPKLGVGIELAKDKTFDSLTTMRLQYAQCGYGETCESEPIGEVAAYDVDSLIHGRLIQTQTGILIRAEESLRDKIVYLADRLFIKYVLVLLAAACLYLGIVFYSKIFTRRRYIALLTRTHDLELNLKNKLALEMDIDNWSDVHTGLPILLVLESEGIHSVSQEHGPEIAMAVRKEMRNRLVGLIGADRVYFLVERNQFALLLSDKEQNLKPSDVHEIMNAEYKLTNHNFWLTHSVGVAEMSPSETRIQLIKHANIALYEAKKERNSVHRFCEEVNHAYECRVELEQNLKRAIVNGEFFVNYQLQVDNDNNVFGIEALARWEHPKHGVISPVSFIPIAESAGMMPVLGQAIYRLALAGIVELSKEFDRLLPLSVNVSPTEFLEKGFYEGLVTLVEEFNYKPNLLTLEITETSDIHDFEAFIAEINRLKQFGFKLSLDDFGTGYSSLNLLARLPVDEVKIDRSFVMNVKSNSSYKQIIESIVSIASNLGLRVVAEGVETLEQQSLLTEMGTDGYQGFLYSRPSTITELSKAIHALKS